jgi:hypothetical protein
VSLLWRDRLGVALFPDRLLLARVGRGMRARLKHKEMMTLVPAEPGTPLWQPAVDALAGKVAAGALSGTEASVVLSSFFVHYTLVPWSDALGSEEEEIAFVRHCFARIYGDQASGWTLKLSRSAPGKAQLACGVETALIDALNKAMKPAGRTYCSLQPHLMVSFNRWRARLGERPMWFVAAEPGLLSLALLRDGQWQSVRTVKVGADWLKQLPGVLTREECLVDSTADCNDVLLFAPDGPEPIMLEGGKWRIKNLLPTLLPGMAAGVDAPFSIAVGV